MCLQKGSNNITVSNPANRLIKTLFHYVFLVLLVTDASAQEVKPKPVFQNFTVDEGLLSNEVYHIIQDSIGYMWIATENGINRFNGVDFQDYTIDDGLVDNTIYEIYGDRKGRLWFISNRGALVYFEHDTINLYPFNTKITDRFTVTRGPIKKSFLIDSLENVHVSFKRYGRFTIGTDGACEKLAEEYDEGVVVMEKTRDGTILISTPLEPQTKNFIYIDKAKNQKYAIDYRELSHARTQVYNIYCIAESDDSFLMAVYGAVYRVKNGEIVQKKSFGEEIIWMSMDNDGNLWVAPIEGGVYCFANANFMMHSAPFMLNKVMVTSVWQDMENGYWFSSLAHGVFYSPNINILHYDSESYLPNNRVSTVFANRSGVYLGYETGVVSRLYKNRITNYTIGGERSSRISIRYLGIDSTSSETWIGSTFYLYHLLNDKIVTYRGSTKPTGIYPRDVVRDNNNNFWVATAQGLKLFNGEKIVYDSFLSNDFSTTINSVYQDSSGCLWLGCVNGLWIFKDEVYTNLGQQDPIFAKQINSIKGIEDGIMLLATNGLGLIALKGNEVNRITMEHGLPSNHIKKIFIDQSGIWLATNNGVSWIRNKKELSDIQNINISHGLPTNDVNSIFARGNRVFVATTKGLAVFDRRAIVLNTVKAKCKILNVKVNGEEVRTNASGLQLPYNQGHVSFDFIGLSYKNMGNVCYRYRMSGLDSSWVYTHSTNAIFFGLPHGSYFYEVQAQNSEGIWGNSASIPIIIKPPYWKRAWFIALFAAILSSTFFLIYLVRIRAIKRMNQIESSINMYKQQSLRQQMNPHFIFNTLNSIQLYILEKDSISSHKYLTKFAKLVRMTLDNSQYQSTSLKNELDALKLYLELEALRLEDSFNYSIEVEDNELLVKSIPTLLLQPFVENSIWHGIMHKPKQEGWIKIRVGSENGLIKCTIEDNGIGRKAAQEKSGTQNGKHNSLGYKITSQRIELLNTLYSGKFNIQYEDLYAPDGTATGTRVVITIPCN
ncbi:MAG TPA: two-component regulator propeller domain-containing protein [Tenuifilaceae bacterium]|nr:two-component regulator propeller domain-containing protein [Tenuifilaceae bacterium]